MWLNEHNKLILLKGAMDETYRRGLRALVRAIETPSDESLSGVAPFDRLHAGQQLVLLDQVSTALFDASTPAPEPAAIMDLSVAAVFGRIVKEITAELRGGTLNYWRHWLIEAGTEAGFRTVPAMTEKDPDTWETDAKMLRNRLIRETPAENYDQALDDRRLAARMRDANDLPATYYTVIAPDPDEAEVAAARDHLDQLTSCCAMTDLRLRFQQSRGSASEARVPIGAWVEHETDERRLRGPVLAMTDRLCVFEVRDAETITDTSSESSRYANEHLAVPWHSVRVLASSEQEARNLIEYVHPRSTHAELHSVRPERSPTPVAVFWRREDADAWAKQQPSSYTVVSRNFDPLPDAPDSL